MDEKRKLDAAHATEVATSVAAGSVAGTLGAAKLRDAYAKEHPKTYARAEKKVARAIGAKPAKFLAHAEPGFKPLAAATGLAVVATGAKKYREHHDKKVSRSMSHHEVTRENVDALHKAIGAVPLLGALDGAQSSDKKKSKV